MPLGQVVVQRHGAARRGQRARHQLVPGRDAAVRGHREPVGQPRPRLCVIRVERHRLLEALDRLGDRGPSPVQQRSALQVEFVRREVLRRRASCGSPVAAEREAQPVSDRRGDLVLHREDVLDHAVVAVGPELVAVGGIHQLHRNAQAGARASQRSFKHGGNTQLGTHRTQVLVLPLEGERRTATGDAQPGNLRERIENLLGHAIGEHLVVGVAAQAREREDGERLLRSRGARGARRRFNFSKRRREQRAGLVAIDRRPLQGRLQSARDRARHAFAQRLHVGRRLHESLGDHRLRVGSRERGLADEHLVEHAAERVEVAAPIDALADRLFRTHVRRGADADPCLRERVAPRVAHCLADAEVGHERMPVLKHDVLGLDVAVDHVVPMRIVERSGHFLRNPHGFGHGELAGSVHPVAERLPFHIGHHIEERAVSFARIVQRQDVRMAESRGELDFAQEPVAAYRLGEVGSHDLDRDVAVMLEVAREVDRGHASRAEFALDAVAVGKSGRERLKCAHFVTGLRGTDGAPRSGANACTFGLARSLGPRNV